MVKEIAFTACRVTDMARAQQSYEGLPGLTPTTNFQGMWIEYEIGGGAFALAVHKRKAFAP